MDALLIVSGIVAVLIAWVWLYCRLEAWAWVAAGKRSAAVGARVYAPPCYAVMRACLLCFRAGVHAGGARMAASGSTSAVSLSLLAGDLVWPKGRSGSLEGRVDGAARFCT